MLVGGGGGVGAGGAVEEAWCERGGGGGYVTEVCDGVELDAASGLLGHDREVVLWRYVCTSGATDRRR